MEIKNLRILFFVVDFSNVYIKNIESSFLIMVHGDEEFSFVNDDSEHSDTDEDISEPPLQRGRDW